MPQTLETLTLDLAMKGLEKVLGDLAKVKEKSEQTDKALGAKGKKNVDETAESLKKAKEKAGQLQGALGGVQMGLGAIAAVAGVAGGVFAGGLGTILSLVKTADPMGWQFLSVQIEILSMRIGRIFIPILRTLENVVRSVSGFVLSLTKAEMGQILTVTKVSLVVAGFVAVLGGLVVALGVAFFAIAAFIVKLNVLLASNPAGWVIIVVAAIAALVVAVIAAVALIGGGLFVLGQKGATFGEKFTNAIKMVWAVVKPILGWFADLFNKLSVVIQAFATVFVQELEKTLSLLGTDWKGAMDTAAAAFEGLKNAIVLQAELIAMAILSIIVAIRRAAKAFMALQKLKQSATSLATTGVTGLIFGRGRQVTDMKDAAKDLTEAMSPSGFMDEMRGMMGRFKDEKKKAEVEKKKPEEMTPKYITKKPELMGIGEAIRRAQTAQTDDPRLELLQEQLRTQREAVQRIKELTEAVEGGGLVV